MIYVNILTIFLVIISLRNIIFLMKKQNNKKNKLINFSIFNIIIMFEIIAIIVIKYFYGYSLFLIIPCFLTTSILILNIIKTSLKSKIINQSKIKNIFEEINFVMKISLMVTSMIILIISIFIDKSFSMAITLQIISLIMAIYLLYEVIKSDLISRQKNSFIIISLCIFLGNSYIISEIVNKAENEYNQFCETINMKKNECDITGYINLYNPYINNDGTKYITLEGVEKTYNIPYNELDKNLIEDRMPYSAISTKIILQAGSDFFDLKTSEEFQKEIDVRSFLDEIYGEYLAEENEVIVRRISERYYSRLVNENIIRNNYKEVIQKYKDWGIANILTKSNLPNVKKIIMKNL